MPGGYSWWSVCLPDDLQPPNLPPLLHNAPAALHIVQSLCLTSSYASVYETTAMITDCSCFSSILLLVIWKSKYYIRMWRYFALQERGSSSML